MQGTLRKLFLAAAVLFPVATAEAVMLPMTLDSAQSSIMLGGEFGGFPFAPQAVGSDLASYSGSILVDLDNALAPTSIQLLGGSATASISGLWLPEAGGGTGPGVPGTAENANYGLMIDLGNLAGGQDAFGAGRNFVFDVISGVEAVAGGNFASNQTLTYISGTFDANAPPVPILNPPYPGDALSLPLTGAVLTNVSASSSTYAVVGSTATLTIPIEIVLEVDDLELTYAGQLVATARVPEPSSVGLLVAMVVGLCGIARFSQKRR